MNNKVSATVLQFGEREMLIVGDWDVLVRLHSSAVNPSDMQLTAFSTKLSYALIS